MQADARRTRLAAIITVAEQYDLIAEDGSKHFERRLVGDQVRRWTTFPLDIRTVALVRAVVPGNRLLRSRLRLQLCNLICLEQIGDDQISLSVIDIHERTSTSMSSNQLQPTPSCRRLISTALASAGGGPSICRLNLVQSVSPVTY